MVHKLTARLGDYWLLLAPVRESTWRLQVWGDTLHEAEVVAEDQEQAKETAVAAAIKKLRDEGYWLNEPTAVEWNEAVSSETRLSGDPEQ